MSKRKISFIRGVHLLLLYVYYYLLSLLIKRKIIIKEVQITEFQDIVCQLSYKCELIIDHQKIKFDLLRRSPSSDKAYRIITGLRVAEEVVAVYKLKDTPAFLYLDNEVLTTIIKET